MPLEIIQHDITQMHVDAIVNPSNTYLVKGHKASVSGQIYAAAGELELSQACKALSPIQVGDVVITPGYNLPAQYIIHSAGPRWMGGQLGEVDLLSQTYRNALDLALKHEFATIAFPLLSSGSYAFPKADALKTAVGVIQDFVLKYDILVYLVVYDPESFNLSRKLSRHVSRVLDDLPSKALTHLNKAISNIDDYLKAQDEPFSDYLMKLIDQKQIKPVDAYKRSNISKATFSKINSNIHYKPSKSTALAFCIGLGLNLNESQVLLQKAGYGLSSSSRQDLIVRYFIESNKHDIFEVNEVLFDQKEPLLGSSY